MDTFKPMDRSNIVERPRMYDKYRGCRRKIAFTTKERAEAFLVGHKDRSNLNSYWCDNCQNWHIGHAGGRQAK